MGIIYGLINMAVAYWYYNTAISVRKPAFKWAGIGAAVFLSLVFLGNMGVKQVQTSMQQSSLEQLVDKGYTPTAESTRKVYRQKKSKEFSAMALFNDLFPLLLALAAVMFVRAKALMGVGIMESIKKGESSPAADNNNSES